MKVAVMVDVHGNLPALDAVLKVIEKEGCDAIYHVGDVMGIGPFQRECLDLLLKTPRIRFIMGNHDAWFAFGPPNPRPSWMSEKLMETLVGHHHWVESCVGHSLKSVVAQWPYVVEEQWERVGVTFVHYGLNDSGKDFVPLVKDARPEDLDQVFHQHTSRALFYGHTHLLSDVTGRRRYFNPGALGCHVEPAARFAFLDIGKDGQCEINPRAIPYDEAAVITAFEARQVPGRDFMLRAFFGRGEFSW